MTESRRASRCLPALQSTSFNTGGQDPGSISRRNAILATMATLNSEAAWRYAVNTAANAAPLLPPGTIEQFESGRAVVIPNWISSAEVSALREDVQNCFQGGHFEKFAYQKTTGKDINPYMMKSFSPATKNDGPFVNPAIGNYALRQSMKLKMAQVKAELASGLHGRPSLANDWTQTHEMEYLRYGVGGKLERHVDERHVELKRVNGSHLPKKPQATRRSVTWLVYLNDDDWTASDGGQLRLHERAQPPPSTTRVGANGPDLQVGWLKATSSNPEQPVFLDPNQESDKENESCMLYTVDGSSGERTNLSEKPFDNRALHVPGGDQMARKVMVDSNTEASQRLHLIAAPKSRLDNALLAADAAEKGEDGGERVRDIVPAAGTLVMFDSVSLPHEVMETQRERFAVQGWFHEQLYY